MKRPWFDAVRQNESTVEMSLTDGGRMTMRQDDDDDACCIYSDAAQTGWTDLGRRLEGAAAATFATTGRECDLAALAGRGNPDRCRGARYGNADFGRSCG